MLLDVDIEKKLGDFTSRIRFSLEGEQSGVFGPSGSGKSTLMNMLAGLVTPDRGHIRLNDKTIFDSSTGTNLPPQKRKIGVVFQQAHLFPHMNVKKNLLYGLQRNARGTTAIDPAQLISTLQLDELLQRRVTRLSGGEKQRVALGRTILANPDLILMDEPLTGLDGKLKYQIIPHLQRVFNKLSIPMLFISHDIQEMRLMTREVLVIREGSVENKLPVEELARSSSMTGRRYMNLMQLEFAQDLVDLTRYRWGNIDLRLVKTHDTSSGRFSLEANDILLFKEHPEAASARNMLTCTVRGTYQTDWLAGVELECHGMTLIAEVVPQSIKELDIKPGSQVIAVIKASAFTRIY